MRSDSNGCCGSMRSAWRLALCGLAVAMVFGVQADRASAQTEEGALTVVPTAELQSPVATQPGGKVKVTTDSAQSAQRSQQIIRKGGGVVEQAPEGPAPANDLCANAIDIFDGLNAIDTTGALTDGVGHPGTGCEYMTDGGQLSLDIWFDYSATCSGILTLSTCNDGDPATGDSTFDSRLALYDCGGAGTACDTLPCPPTATELLECNDDGLGCAGFSSILTTSVVMGNEYRVRVGGFNAAAFGTATLSISCVQSVCGDASCGVGEDVCNCPADCGAPAVDESGLCADGMDNDCDGDIDCADTDCQVGTESLCADGIDNDCDGIIDCFDVDCVAATPDCDGPCNESGANCQPFDLANATVSDTTSQTTADNFLPDAAGSISSVCFYGAYLPAVVSPDAFQITYYADAGGIPGAIVGGPFVQGVDLVVSAPFDTGQLVAGLAPIQEYTATHAAVAVTTDCHWIEITNDVVTWFWQDSLDGDLTEVIDIGATGYDVGDIDNTNDRAFCLDITHNDTGCFVSAPEICNDGIDNDGDSLVDCDDVVDCAADLNCQPPANDDCVAAVVVGDGDSAFDTTNATLDGTAPVACDPNLTEDVWFVYTATCNGSAVVGAGCNDLAADEPDTVVEIFGEGTCPPATSIGCADDNCGNGSGFAAEATGAVVMGNDYLIRVSGFNGSDETGILSIACVADGACCDDATATCNDPVSAAACPAPMRFSPGETCMTQDPQCGTSACCLPDGTCQNVLDATACTTIDADGQFRLGLFCSDTTCNAADDCDFDNGAPTADANGLISQYDPVAMDYVEAADDFILKGTPNGCDIDSLTWFAAYGPCDALVDPTCLGDPSDWDAIRVVIYNDGEDAGDNKLIESLDCGSLLIPDNDNQLTCTVDADCVDGGTCVDSDGDGIDDSCGAECDIVVSAMNTIDDLDVDLLIAHTFQGDVTARLTHLNTGTSIQLINQPGLCGGANAFGYGSANFGDPIGQAPADNLILSDEALFGIDVYGGCPGAGGIADFAGPAQPTEPLAAFNGETKEGTWRITVVDAEVTGADSGTLINWSLHFNNAPSAPKGPTGNPVVDGMGIADGTHTGTPAPKVDITTTNYTFVAGPVADTWEILIDLSAEGITLDKNKKNWLAVSAEHDAAVGVVGWMFSQTSNNNDAQQYNGAIPAGWAPTGTDLAFVLNGTKEMTGSSCPNFLTEECADLVDNGTLLPGADGTTDDVCVWWQCGEGTCIGDPTQPCDSDGDCGGAPGSCVPSAPDACLAVALTEPSDMGGGFGNCEPDGFCNNSDINHALLAFATANPCPGINIDAGSPFGACPPDGFSNLFDANHAGACFATVNACNCSGGPAPEIGPNVVGGTGLALEASNRTVRRGATIQVQAYISNPLAALSGYQVHTGVTGGRSGSLDLVDVSIADRDDSVFAKASGVFDAFNVDNSQVLSGLHYGSGAVATAGKGYLATFTYRVSNDAVGTFVIDILHNEAAGDQTFLVGATDRDKIEITRTTPAVVVVTSGASRSIR